MFNGNLKKELERGRLIMNQKMQDDPNEKLGIKLPKNVDVKKLKQNIWKTVEPKIRENSEVKVELTFVVNLLNSMQQRQQADIHSSFICLLHLANEKSKFYFHPRPNFGRARGGRRRDCWKERNH